MARCTFEQGRVIVHLAKSDNLAALEATHHHQREFLAFGWRDLGDLACRQRAQRLRKRFRAALGERLAGFLAAQAALGIDNALEATSGFGEEGAQLTPAEADALRDRESVAEG